MSTRRDDPEVVLAAQRGDQDAFTALFRRWFDPCVDVARRIVHDEGMAAEVAQDTFLVAWRQIGILRDPSAFGGWVLRTTRNRALNRLERERRSVAVDQQEDPALTGLASEDDMASDLGAAEQQELLWAASAALGERDASVLDLHLRHGMGAAELAEELGVTANNAHQLVFRMKGRLAGAIRAWVLYKRGDPTCDELARVLRRSGITSFSAEAVKVIDRHASGCEECSRRRAALLAPEAMFAAVPALPVAGLLREKAAAALRRDGVPLGPDAARPLPADPAGRALDRSATGGSGGAGPSGPPAPPPLPTSAVAPPPSGPGRSRRAALLAVAAAVLVVLVIGLALVASGGDDDEVAADAEEAAAATTTSADVAPTTTAEPDPTSSTTAPTGSTGSTASTATTASVPPPAPPPPPPPPPGPEVVSFTATPASGPAAFCGPAQWPFSLSWQALETTSVTIAAVGATSTPITGGPSGNARGCAPSSRSSWTLEATGPGAPPWPPPTRRRPLPSVDRGA